MTGQLGEILIYQGKEYSLSIEPLRIYFEATGIHPDFVLPNTALWRGYVGTWKIYDDRLWLSKVDASLKNGEEFGLKNLFPESKGDVLASWYSGILRVPDGQVLNYIHSGHDTIYERNILISIDRGCVTKAEVRENGKAKRAHNL